jgi:hypothetical protein
LCGPSGIACRNDEFCEHLTYHDVDTEVDKWMCVSVPSCDAIPTCDCFSAIQSGLYCSQTIEFLCDTSSGSVECAGSSP